MEVLSSRRQSLRLANVRGLSERLTMKRATKLSIAAAGVAAALSVGVFAATDDKRPNDATAVPQAKISLVEAIGTAERHVGGRATRAEYERTAARGAWAYDVEVVTSSKVFDVRVDASNGVVLSASEDRIENDDEHDRKD